MTQNFGRLYTVVISQVANYYQPQLHYKDNYVPAKNYVPPPPTYVHVWFLPTDHPRMEFLTTVTD